MHIIISKSNLLRELNAIAGVVERKTSIPILSNLLIEADTTALSIKGTDLDISLTTRADAEVKTPGAICIPAKKLHDIVKSLPDAEIDIKVDGDAVAIKCGRSRFKMMGLSKDNFPEIKSHDGPFISLPSELLRTFIARTYFAITNEESRYSLNGLKMELGPDRLRMVATDGHRLSFVEKEFDTGADTHWDVLIPKKTLTEVAKLASDTEAVEMVLSDNHIFFRFGPRLLTSRLLSGTFPNYELVLPQENIHKVIAESALLSSAVRRVALMADERSRAIRMEIGDGKIEVIAVSTEAGEASETVSAEYAGPAIVAGFNAQYVSDVLGLDLGERVELLFKDGQSQVEMRPTEDNGTLSRFIVMPQRLG